MSKTQRDVLFGFGLLCLLAAAVGGGVTMGGATIPALASPITRVILAILGTGSLVACYRSTRSERPRDVTFTIRHATSGIAHPSIGSKTFGGGTTEVQAAGFRQSADGKSYIFFDAAGQEVKQIPTHHVAGIDRKP